MISPDFKLCSYFHAVMSFRICEAIFWGRDLFFFMGAHNSVYFVNKDIIDINPEFFFFYLKFTKKGSYIKLYNICPRGPLYKIQSTKILLLPLKCELIYFAIAKVIALNPFASIFV